MSVIVHCSANRSMNSGRLSARLPKSSSGIPVRFRYAETLARTSAIRSVMNLAPIGLRTETPAGVLELQAAPWMAATGQIPFAGMPMASCPRPGQEIGAVIPDGPSQLAIRGAVPGKPVA